MKSKITVCVYIFLLVGLLIAVSYGTWHWADNAKQQYKDVNGKITPTEQRAIDKDALDAWIKILQTLSAAGFFFTAFVSWKNLQNAEDKLITERFSKAVELISESDKLEARMGGIYLLERIAKDYPEDRSTVMEVLTAYVRAKSPTKPSDSTTAPSDLPKVTADIQSALTVISRRDVDNDRKEILNLSRANLHGANLLGANLHGANLSRANLSKANLFKTNLKSADLHEANLTNAKLQFSDLLGANVRDANFKDTDVTGVQNFSLEQQRSVKNLNFDT